VVDKVPVFWTFHCNWTPLCVQSTIVVDLMCTQFQLVETFGFCHISWNLTVAQVGECLYSELK
jgi:hypothetical protein